MKKLLDYYTIIDGPSSYGITVDEVKKWCRITDEVDTNTINDMITSSFNAFQVDTQIPYGTYTLARQYSTSWTIPLAAFEVCNIKQVEGVEDTGSYSLLVDSAGHSYIHFSVLPSTPSVNVVFEVTGSVPDKFILLKDVSTLNESRVWETPVQMYQSTVGGRNAAISPYRRILM